MLTLLLGHDPGGAQDVVISDCELTLTGSISASSVSVVDVPQNVTITAEAFSIQSDLSSNIVEVDPFAFRPGTGTDDAWYDTMTSGAFYPADTLLKAYATTYTWNKSFIRFPGINIPQGAAITRAYVTLYPTVSGTNLQTIYINVADYPDITAPTSWAQVLSLDWIGGIQWDLSSYTLREAVDTPDITETIQSVINNPEWVSGNAVLIEFGPDHEVTPQLKFYSADYGDFTPVLHVEWDDTVTVVDSTPFEVSVSLSGYTSENYTNITADDFQAQAGISGDLKILAAFVHEQSFAAPNILVLVEAPYGQVDLVDPEDGMALEPGAGLVLADGEDALAVEGRVGACGTLAMEDREDGLTTGNGGEIGLGDGADALSLIGMAAAMAACSCGDPVDGWEVRALPGSVAEADFVDAADLLAIRGMPETTGGVLLSDAADRVILAAMGGTAAGIALADGTDAWNGAGAVEESGRLELLDGVDRMNIGGRRVNPFTGHIIQYQKSRY